MSVLVYLTSTTCERDNGSNFYIHKFSFASGEKTRLGSLKKGVNYNLASEHAWTEEQEEMFEGGLEITLEELKEEYDIEVREFFAVNEEGKEERANKDTGEVEIGDWKKANWLYEK